MEHGALLSHGDMAVAIACDQALLYLVNDTLALLIKEDLISSTTADGHEKLQQGNFESSPSFNITEKSCCAVQETVVSDALEKAVQHMALTDAELQQLESEESAIERELYQVDAAKELQLAEQQRALEVAVEAADTAMLDNGSLPQLVPVALHDSDSHSHGMQPSVQTIKGEALSASCFVHESVPPVETGTVAAGQQAPPMLDLPRVDSQTLLARAEAIDSPVASAHRLGSDYDMYAVEPIQSTRNSPELSIAHSVPVAEDVTSTDDAVQPGTANDPMIATVDSFNFGVAASTDEVDAHSFIEQQKERSAAIAEQLAQLQEESRKLQQQSLKLQERAVLIHREALQSGVPAKLLAPLAQGSSSSIAARPAVGNSKAMPVQSNVAHKSRIPCAPVVTSTQAYNSQHAVLQSLPQGTEPTEVMVHDTVEQSSLSKPLRAGLKWQMPQQHKAGAPAPIQSPPTLTKIAHTPDLIQASHAHPGFVYEQVSLRRENSSSSTVEPMLPRWSDQLASTNTSPLHSPEKYRRWESPLRTCPPPDVHGKLLTAVSATQAPAAQQNPKQDHTPRQQQLLGEARPRKYLPEVRLPIIAKPADQAAQPHPPHLNLPSPSYVFGHNAGTGHHPAAQSPPPAALMGLQTQYPNNPMAASAGYQLLSQPMPAVPMHMHPNPGTKEVFVNPSMYSQPSVGPSASQTTHQMPYNPKTVHRPVPHKPGAAKQHNKAGRIHAGQAHNKAPEAPIQATGQHKQPHHFLPLIHQPTGFGAESGVPATLPNHRHYQTHPLPPPYPYQAMQQPVWPIAHMPPGHTSMQQQSASHKVHLNPAWQGQPQGLHVPAMLPYEGVGVTWFPNTQQASYVPLVQQGYAQQVTWSNQQQAHGMLQGATQGCAVAQRGATIATKQAQQKAVSKKAPGFRTY